MGAQRERWDYHTYRKARDIYRHAEYLQRHGYTHPVLDAIKQSARIRMEAWS